jgi:integrase/recombinase XerD
MPKIKGNGKASIWVDEDLAQFLALDLIRNHPDRLLLIALLRYTGERIGAVLQLKYEDCYCGDGRPRAEILFRKRTRKGKVEAREVFAGKKLTDCLQAYRPSRSTGYLFPSPNDSSKPISYAESYRWFQLALQKSQLASSGYSWHSFRRTFATKMAKKLPLSELQKVTGHKSLDVLRGYIEVDPQAIANAMNSL